VFSCVNGESLGGGAVRFPQILVAIRKLAVAILTLTALAFGQSQISFFVPPTYAGSGQIFIADFNGDGKPDILSADGTLQLGNGNGTFTNGTRVSGTPLAVQDFNDDGKPDILEQGTGTLLVLLGNGDGTFQPARSTNTAIGTLYPVVAGDLNGDGKPDVVGVYNSALYVFIANGDGTFKAGVPYALGATDSIRTLTLGDFNGDKKLDVAAADSTAPQIIVFLGNGDGTLQQPAKTSPGVSLAGYAVAADFNNDGKLDLAVSTVRDTSSSSGVFILLGNGDGTFQVPTTVFSNQGPLAVADVNNDGIPDLILVNPADIVDVLLGKGDGTFPIVHGYMLNLQSYEDGAVGVADFNLDGKPDIAAGNYVILGNGNGKFQGQPAVSPNGSAWAFGDFNKDGATDLAEVDGSSVFIFINDGTGALTLTHTYSLPTNSAYGTIGSAIAAADVNGDGNIDLVVIGSDAQSFVWNYSVFLGNGDGTFQSPMFYPQSVGLASDSPTNIVIADFNNDHKPDLTVSLAETTTSQVAILLGNGDGTFGSPIYLFDGSSAASTAPSITSNDFNGDGKADLAASSTAGIAILLGNGDGTFQAANFISTAQFFGPLFSADVNHDGKADLVGSSTSSSYAVGVIQTFLGNGDGTFKTPISSSQGEAAFALADINGDGNPDVVGWQFPSSGAVAYGVYPGDGSGNFGTFINVFSPPTQGVGMKIGPLAAQDLNGDGKPDLVAGEATLFDTPGSGVFVLINTTKPAQPDFTIGPASGSPSSQAISGGQSASFSLSITPLSGFTGTVNLSCSITPKETPAPTCTVPSSANVTGGIAASVQVTVGTTAATGGLTSHAAGLPPGTAPLLWTLALLGLGLLFSRKQRARPAIATATFAMVLLAGCGGSTSSQPGQGGTPAGTYTATVMASSGNLSHSTALTVVVQ
jgi:FG-GAP-like repeat